MKQSISLVTGATGFIGSAVAKKLVQAGHEVRVLCRKQSDKLNIHSMDVKIYNGDLRNEQSYTEALRGCDYLFHVAADYRLWVPDSEKMYNTNVTGTEKLMRAALANNIKKIVYTSTVGTFGINKDGTPSNEDTKVTSEDLIGSYKQTKYLAERRVKDLIRDKQLPAVIVHPSTPIGPGDIKPTPTGRLVLEACIGKVPAFVETGLNVVHVNDVANGHLLALEKGEIGRSYILGGENINLQNLLGEISALFHRHPPKIKLPVSIILPVAYACEGIARVLTKWEPFVTVTGVKLARKPMYFTSQRAFSELGYRARPIQEAIVDAVNWYKENNYY